MNKLEKTIPFDLYQIGDRVMEGVIYLVDIAITEDDKIICTGALAHEDSVTYLQHIGGAATVEHWRQEVLSFFENEDDCAEILGESMTEEEFAEWEHILLPEKAPAVAPRAIKASLASDIVDGWMENN